MPGDRSEMLHRRKRKAQRNNHRGIDDRVFANRTCPRIALQLPAAPIPQANLSNTSRRDTRFRRSFAESSLWSFQYSSRIRRDAHSVLRDRTTNPLDLRVINAAKRERASLTFTVCAISPFSLCSADVKDCEPISMPPPPAIWRTTSPIVRILSASESAIVIPNSPSTSPSGVQRRQGPCLPHAAGGVLISPPATARRTHWPCS